MADAEEKSLNGLLTEIKCTTGRTINDGIKTSDYQLGDIHPAAIEIETRATLDRSPERYDPNEFRWTAMAAMAACSSGHQQTIQCMLKHSTERHICFIGSAGSGKSTMLKFIARLVRKGDLFKDTEIIHFLRPNDFHSNSKTTTFMNILLQQYGVPSRTMEAYASYIKQKSAKVLFIIDSLDSVPGDLSSENQIVGMNEKSKPSTILWNLLTGRFSQQFRVISSSRHYLIWKFKGDLEPEKVIALQGFSMKNMKKVATKYTGNYDSAIQAIACLQEKSMSLLNMCRTPLFLVFALTCWENGRMGTTVTGLMDILLNILIRSRHFSKSHIEMLKQVEKLAFWGISQRKIMFTQADLKKYAIEQRGLSSLAVQGPGGGKKSLMETGNLTSFTHLCVQEALAASSATKEKWTKFRDFVDKDVKLPHFSVVKQFLSGILLNRAEIIEDESFFVTDVHENDLKRKADFFREHLRSELRDQDLKDSLSLVLCLRESGSAAIDLIKENLKFVRISRKPLSPADIHAVGSAVNHANYLESLSLNQCFLNDELVDIFWECIKDGDTPIDLLSLRNNFKITPKGMNTVGKIISAKQPKTVNLSACDLTAQHLESLAQNLEEGYIKCLDVSHNTMDHRGLAALGSLVSTTSIEELNATHCYISHQSMATFEEHLVNAKIKTLNLGANREVRSDFTWLRKTLQKGQLQHLLLDNCGIVAKAMKEFADSLKWNIRTLSLKTKEHVASDFDVSNIERITDFVTEQLTLNGWKFNDSQITVLQKKLDNSPSTKLRVKSTEFEIERHDPARDSPQARNEDGNGVSKTNGDREGNTDLYEIKKDEKSVESKFVSIVVHPDSAAKLEVDNCSIVFPIGSVAKKIVVKARAIPPRLAEKLPKTERFRIDVTPTIECKPSGTRFLKPIRFQLSTWIRSNHSAIAAKIFRGADIEQGSVKWTNIGTVAISNSETLSFQHDTFCFFKITTLFRSDNRIILNYFLSNDRHNNFYASVCVADMTIRRDIIECDNLLDRHVFSLHDRLTASVGSKIAIKLSSNNQKFQFTKEVEEFIIDRTFVEETRSRAFTFCLENKDSSDNSSESISLTYQVASSEERTQSIIARWHGIDELAQRNGGLHLYPTNMNLIQRSENTTVHTDSRVRSEPSTRHGIFVSFGQVVGIIIICFAILIPTMLSYWAV